MKDELEGNAPFIMINVEHDETVLAKWQPMILFDDTHGGVYEPLGPFVFEVMNEKEQIRNRSESRTMRLYIDRKPALGCQWHDHLETAFRAAEYLSASYIYNRKAKIELQHKMVRYK